MLVDTAVTLSAVTRPLALTAFSVVLAVALGLRRRALALVSAVVGTGVVAHLLKYVIGRERPPVDLRLVEETNPAMPSGHATGVAAFAMILTLWLWPRGGWWRLAVVGAWAVAFLVGAARVVLGVHWVSDVVAGWALGAGGAWLVWRASQSVGMA